MNQLTVSYNFYKQYHRNYINKLIHIIAIPSIVWSTLGIINNNKYLRKIKLPEIIYLFYSIKFLKYNFEYGLLCNLIYGYLLYRVKNDKISNNTYYKVFLSSWIFQFIGHYVEGRKPALLTSVRRSVTIAPYFVIFDLF